MIGVDLLGAEGGHHDHRCPPLPDLALPAVEEPDGQLVGPLAVVEQHEGGPDLRSQSVEEEGQGEQAAGLAVGLRAEVSLPSTPDEMRQLRKGSGNGVGVIAQAVRDAGGQPGVGIGRRQQVVGDALEELEGTLGGLVDGLAAHNPRAAPGRLLRQFVEQTGLAAARTGLHERQSAAAVSGLLQLADEHCQLGLTADERRLGQRVPPVALADDHARVGDARRHRGGDLLEVGEHGTRRLVAI